MATKKQKVTLEGPKVRSWKSLEKILKTFAQTLKTDILVSQHRGTLVPVRSVGGKLFIRLFAGPDLGVYSGLGFEEDFGPSREYDPGWRVVDLIAPSLVGTHITDSNDNVVAEVVGGSLFILTDIAELLRPSEALFRIMTDYAAKAPQTLTARKEALAKAKEKVRQKSWRNFRQVFATRLSSKEQKKQWRILGEMAKGGEVIATADELRLPVGRVTMNVEDKRSNIGRWVLVIDRWKNVSFRLLNPEEAEETHYFIRDDGTACLGTIDYAVDNYVKKERYELAFFLMLRFLETGADQDEIWD